MGGSSVQGMTAKALSAPQKAAKAVGEVFFQNEAVSLCLLINRRARTMRVIDFRAGPSPAKRTLVHSLAQREGVEKIYTLVERDEVQTWLKLGFAKEGNIPGFYKRSDAFLLGTPVRARGPVGRPDVPLESETRIIAAEPVTSAAPPLTPAQMAMERTIVAAKRLLKELSERSTTGAKVTDIDEVEARKAVAVAMRSGRAITGFEPFGRDVERRYFSVSVRGGFQLVASTESQACFGNTYLELLVAPRTDAERLHTAVALRALCERLLASGVVSCFSLAPSGDVSLAAAFLHNGFRRTGLLVDHLVVGASRRDAILWSRKLANPADE
jgi:hypothetical protein